MNVKKPVFTCEIGPIMDSYLDKYAHEHAEASVKNVCKALTSLDTYLQTVEYSGGTITFDTLADWAEQISVGRAPGTVEQYEKNVRTFLKYAEVFGIKSQMVDLIKVPDDYEPYIFTQKELDDLCSAADNISFHPESSYPWIHAEIPMLTRIYIACGTRTEETLVLQKRDVDLEKGVFTMRTTKGDFERYVPFTDELKDMLERYCRAVGILSKPDAYLFPGKTLDKSFSQDMYHNCFKKMVAVVGIDVRRERKQQRAVCPYCMRHTFACMAVVRLQKQGVIVDNLFPYLSAYMGHKDLYSTERYLKLSEPLMTEALSGYEEKMKSLFTGRTFDRDEVWD